MTSDFGDKMQSNDRISGFGLSRHFELPHVAVDMQNPETTEYDTTQKLIEKLDYYMIGTTIMCIGSSVKAGMTTNTRYLLPRGWSSMENSSRIIGGVLILCIVLTAFFIVLLTTPPESIVEGEEVFFEDISGSYPYQ